MRVPGQVADSENNGAALCWQSALSNTAPIQPCTARRGFKQPGVPWVHPHAELCRPEAQGSPEPAQPRPGPAAPAAAAAPAAMGCSRELTPKYTQDSSQGFCCILSVDARTYSRLSLPCWGTGVVVEHFGLVQPLSSALSNQGSLQ